VDGCENVTGQIPANNDFMLTLRQTDISNSVASLLERFVQTNQKTTRYIFNPQFYHFYASDKVLYFINSRNMVN
jgi:hypothetical protein